MKKIAAMLSGLSLLAACGGDSTTNDTNDTALSSSSVISATASCGVALSSMAVSSYTVVSSAGASLAGWASSVVTSSAKTSSAGASSVATSSAKASSAGVSSIGASSAGASSGSVVIGPPSLIPEDGQNMTIQVAAKPYVIGSWFTWRFHDPTTITPDSTKKEPFVASKGKMCATLAKTAGVGGGGAISFRICSAPKYPDAAGAYKWYPLNCTDNPDPAVCIPSDKRMPISHCGGKLKAITFDAEGVPLTFVALMDSNDKGIGEAGNQWGEHKPVGGRLDIPAGREGDVASIHFKAFADGEFCISNVQFEFL